MVESSRRVRIRSAFFRSMCVPPLLADTERHKNCLKVAVSTLRAAKPRHRGTISSHRDDSKPCAPHGGRLLVHLLAQAGARRVTALSSRRCRHGAVVNVCMCVCACVRVCVCVCVCVSRPLLNATTLQYMNGAGSAWTKKTRMCVCVCVCVCVS
jgi:hypothetical protein